MANCTFDYTTSLIEQVELRPILWNPSFPDYAKISAKRIAWSQIVDYFSDVQDGEDTKRILEAELQKKWKLLRDAYVRELKKIRTRKSFVASFSHFYKMNFLESCVSHKDVSLMDPETTSRNALAAACMLKANESKHNVVSTLNMYPTSVKQTYNNDLDNHSMMSSSMSQSDEIFPKKEEDDPDKLYCLSLWQEMKKVPENQRLPLKIEIYSLILKHQTQSNVS